jgi:putative transcription factor
MSDCERCGKRSKLQEVEIAGARMYVCPDCVRFGKVIKEKAEPTTQSKPLYRAKTPRPPKPDALTRGAKELAEDYPKRIQRGREKKGWSREDLGRKINERVSVIAKLEHGQMHPSDNLIKKIERALEIELKEFVEDVHVTHSAESRGMTLADFIVYKDK